MLGKHAHIFMDHGKAVDIVGYDKSKWTLASKGRTFSANNVFELNGEVPTTVMKGETVNITHLCKFGWYDWVYFRDNAVTYPNDKWVLGTWLGPQFKDNGRCVYRSSYRHLTEDEPNRLEEKKKKESYDQLIHSKLGSPELQRTLKRIIQLLSMSCMKMMIGMVFLMPGNARMNQLPSHMTHILVLKINVNIDCKFNEVPNLLGEKDILDCNTRQSVALFVCFYNSCVQR